MYCFSYLEVGIVTKALRETVFGNKVDRKGVARAKKGWRAKKGIIPERKN